MGYVKTVKPEHPLGGVETDKPEVPLGDVGDLADIDDGEVPLAVINDDDLDGEMTEIEETEVPLVGAAAAGVNWSWIPVIGAVLSGAEGYRENKKKKAADEKKKDDQSKS